jgi:hypothetical protein
MPNREYRVAVIILFITILAMPWSSISASQFPNGMDKKYA